MLAAALPANARAYQLAHVVDFDLLNQPVTCYEFLVCDHALCQLLAIRPSGVLFATTMFNTETGSIEDWMCSGSATVIVVPEPDEVTEK